MSTPLTIIFEEAEEGGYTATIAEFPGAISEGDTIEEAREMVLDALKELMAARREIAIKESGGRRIVETFDLSA